MKTARMEVSQMPSRRKGRYERRQVKRNAKKQAKEAENTTDKKEGAGNAK